MALGPASTHRTDSFLEGAPGRRGEEAIVDGIVTARGLGSRDGAGVDDAETG